MVGEHCDRCSTPAVVCEMCYTCSLWQLFHHVVKRSYTKRRAPKPDFVVCGIKLLSLTISWSLKQNIWRWIEMAQVVLERFYWASFSSREGKYLRIRFIFSICEATLVIFCSRKGTRLTSVQFEVFNTLWKRESIAGVNCRWFSHLRLPKKRLRCNQALSRLLFFRRHQLFFPFSLGIFSKSEVRNNGKWFVVWLRAKEMISGGSYRFRGWTFVIRGIFLPRGRAKTLQTSIQFFFWHFFYWFRKCSATRTSRPLTLR